MIETGHIDAMISIRSNFFYTRSVPCELWFFNKAKTEEQLDKVLMIDARNVYRKVTRKIYDFSPEQLKNLTSIVWLYRGETGKFLKLLESHINKSMTEAIESKQNLSDYKIKLQELIDKINPFLASQKEGSHKETQAELTQAKDVFIADIEKYKQSIDALNQEWQGTSKNNKSFYSIAQKLSPVTEQSKDLIKQADLLYKLCETLIRTCENELNAKDSDKWTGKDIRKLIKELDEQRKLAVEQLKLPRYFYKQAHWLQERFPEAKLRDIEGLVKVVSRKDIEDNDYSLTPGRYVGVAAEEVDEDFDFEETLKDIHIELSGLNEEAVQLAAQIAKNFEELGV
jgi:type I restriction enzyme M protein